MADSSWTSSRGFRVGSVGLSIGGIMALVTGLITVSRNVPTRSDVEKEDREIIERLHRIETELGERTKIAFRQHDWESREQWIRAELDSIEWRLERCEERFSSLLNREEE